MTEITRSPAMIAGEINTIKEQVRTTALSAWLLISSSMVICISAAGSQGAGAGGRMGAVAQG